MEQIKEVATTHLGRKHRELVRRREALIESFVRATAGKQPARMGKAYRRICQTNEFLASLERIEQEAKPATDAGGHCYVVSSLFLYECFAQSTADEKEQFVFITGSEVNGTMVLDQIIELVHDRRTVGGVEAEPKSTHRLLIKLEQFGHRLLAHFHSHPGRGPDATHPSGIDRRFQQRLENAGHVAAAAIFSRDGYVRFFRLDGNLDLRIHGNGVRECERSVYHLTDLPSR
jgi:proteasome lid subunit RPN8/RPN11